MKKGKKASRILFIGGKQRGLELVRYLIAAGYNLVGIYCQKEEEHEAVKFSPRISSFAKKLKIPFVLARSINKEKHIRKISSLMPDLIIVMGWPTLITKRILDIPKLGAIAVHESKLPAYRGFAPVSWQIINGEKRIWLSLFYLEAGMDSGDVIKQKSLAIGKNEYIATIYKKTGQMGLAMIKEGLGRILAGKAHRRKQNHRLASYACPRTPADGQIDWNWPTHRIYNLIRAVSHPYPGAFSYYEGKKIYIWEAEIPTQQRYIGRITGHVIKVWHGKGTEVLTGDGQLLLTKVQLEGEKETTGDNILRSIKKRLGQ